MTVSKPPASATFISPRKSAIIPTSPMARVTAPPAASTIAVPSAAIGDTLSADPGTQLHSR